MKVIVILAAVYLSMQLSFYGGTLNGFEIGAVIYGKEVVPAETKFVAGMVYTLYTQIADLNIYASWILLVFIACQLLKERFVLQIVSLISAGLVTSSTAYSYYLLNSLDTTQNVYFDLSYLVSAQGFLNLVVATFLLIHNIGTVILGVKKSSEVKV